MAIVPINIRLDIAGNDGNILIVIAKIESAMRKAGIPREIIEKFSRDVRSASSYTAALGRAANWVKINGDEFVGLT